MPIAGEGHDPSRGLAGELAEAGDDAEAPLILDSGCRVPLAGDSLRAFVVRAVNALAERNLTGEAAPTGVPEPPADEPAPRWAAPHRAAAIMGEPAHWRDDDTPHNTAGNREGVPVTLTLGGRSQSLTEAYVDGGAGVLAPGRGGPAVIRTRPLLGALLTTAAAAFALAAYGGSSEGTVVAKTDQGVHDYACQAGGTVTGPVAVPMWGACSVPKCWRLVIRDSDGNTSEPCVSREEYDRTRLGAFWRGRTDR